MKKRRKTNSSSIEPMCNVCGKPLAKKSAKCRWKAHRLAGFKEV